MSSFSREKEQENAQNIDEEEECQTESTYY